MPTYSYKCAECQHCVDMDLSARKVPEAVTVPCHVASAKRCSLPRNYSASFGLGPVAGAGMTPSRQTGTKKGDPPV